MDIVPVCPGANRNSDGVEPQGIAGHGDDPKHLRDGHSNEPDVAGHSERGVACEVSSKCHAADYKVTESETLRKMSIRY